LLGLRSKSSVAALVARLKFGGYIESTPDRRIAPTRRFFERPLAEAPVHAGLPNPVDDAPADALTIDDYLIDRPSQTVLVRVKGDSMTDAGIFEGDLVVVEKAQHARRGDDRHRHRRQPVHLKRSISSAASSSCAPKTRPSRSSAGRALEIFGVMVGLVRKYN
jgi:SOS-response transcriptional repressors (RecA-mediated autopeptidases)